MDSAERLTKSRKEKKMLQTDLAAASGLSASLIAQIEQGRKKLTETTAQKLAAALDVSPDFLLCRIDPEDEKRKASQEYNDTLNLALAAARLDGFEIEQGTNDGGVQGLFNARKYTLTRDGETITLTDGDLLRIGSSLFENYRTLSRWVFPPRLGGFFHNQR